MSRAGFAALLGIAALVAAILVVAQPCRMGVPTVAIGGVVLVTGCAAR